MTVVSQPVKVRTGKSKSIGSAEVLYSNDSIENWLLMWYCINDFREQIRKYLRKRRKEINQWKRREEISQWKKRNQWKIKEERNRWKRKGERNQWELKRYSIIPEGRQNINLKDKGKTLLPEPAKKQLRVSENRWDIEILYPLRSRTDSISDESI